MKPFYSNLLALMLVTFVLGSVHAFSVFIVALETRLQLPRSDISLIYSLALVSITVSVLFGYRIYSLGSPPKLLSLTALAASFGLYIASISNGWWMLFVGYGLLFGLANGIGYGFSLQLAGRLSQRRGGFAMAAVTAAYAIGSIVFAQLIAWRLVAESVASAFIYLAAVVFICIGFAALVLHRNGATYQANPMADNSPLDRRKVGQFWLAYLTSVFAGLMAIGHAAGIALANGADTRLATLAAVLIGAGSGLGGFIAGWLVDRWSLKGLLVGLPILSAMALLAIAMSREALTVVILLSLVGFAYGSIIAIYPVAIARYFGAMGAMAYGRVFTAWGLAGLIAPWAAGWLYDLQQNYRLAMFAAAAVALVSVVCATLFRFEKPS